MVPNKKCFSQFLSFLKGYKASCDDRKESWWIIVYRSFSGLLFTIFGKTHLHTLKNSLFLVVHKFDKRQLFDFRLFNFINFVENFLALFFFQNTLLRKSLFCVCVWKVCILSDWFKLISYFAQFCFLYKRMSSSLCCMYLWWCRQTLRNYTSVIITTEAEKKIF